MACPINRPSLSEREIARRHLRIIEMSLRAADRADAEAEARNDAEDSKTPAQRD